MGYAIDFSVFAVLASPDPVLRLAAWIAAGACILTFLLIGAILLLRVSRKLYEWHARRFAGNWRPLLASCTVEAPTQFPRVRRRDRIAFLYLWNHHYELLRGQTLQNLRLLAIGAGIRPVLLRNLHHLSMRSRLVAATTLGHLRATPARPELLRLTHHRSAAVSFAAARALLEIDPGAHLPPLLLMIAERDDWPLSRIALALRDLGATQFSIPLANAAIEASRQPTTLRGLPRLLHLMELAHAAQVMPAVDQLLKRADELGPDVIAPCLRLIHDPRKAHWARTFATHDIWYVRVTAANALRRAGAAEDRELLNKMLCDAHWWVRYRAAQALISLPLASLDAWEETAAAHSDQYAGEMLRHAIAEQRLSQA